MSGGKTVCFKRRQAFQEAVGLDERASTMKERRGRKQSDNSASGDLKFHRTQMSYSRIENPTLPYRFSNFAAAFLHD